jgi:molybdopterin synthase sulfur carrier subunit
MITVKFFAFLREQLGQSQIDIETQTPISINDLLSQLHAMHPSWEQILQSQSVLCAINHTLVSMESVVNVGDEVAFFPPVTGG